MQGHQHEQDGESSNCTVACVSLCVFCTAVVICFVQLSSSVHLYVTHCCVLCNFLHTVGVCLCSQNVKLTDWMLVMCKLAETQMLLAMSSADEQQERIEKLEKQVDKLKLKNTQLSSTIEQQKSVITGIQDVLQHSGTTPAK